MTPRDRIPETAIEQLRREKHCDEIAGRLVALRRLKPGRFVGPCPLHSPDRQARDSTAFECWSDGWVCARCQEGGDIIKLVMLVDGIGFREAFEKLGGEYEVDTEKAKQIEADAKVESEKKKADENWFRERERSIAFDIWVRARSIVGTAGEAYLGVRGIVELPPDVHKRLRFVPKLPFYVDRAKQHIIIHDGPAMVAPIIRPDGRFGGVHRTWIDLEKPKGKAVIVDPQTGETYKNRKSRGSTKAGRIEFVSIPDARRLIIGEGIEKVGAVWLALKRTGDDLTSTAFWTSIDLGNLGGTSDKAKRARGPNPFPRLEDPGIPIPDSVEKIIILGDSTSDRLTTRCAIARAETRWRKPGRVILVAWSPDGQDFDDLLRAA